jgi:hypothetical protein
LAIADFELLIADYNPTRSVELSLARRFNTGIIVLGKNSSRQRRLKSESIVPASKRRAKVTPTLRVGLCSRQTINKP